MTPAERAALMGLADEWVIRSQRDMCRGEYASGRGEGYETSAHELRALLAEFEREEG